MTTAYLGVEAGANEANHDVSSFEDPFGLLPKTCQVPVLPATSTGKFAKTPAAVPRVATARSAT